MRGHRKALKRVAAASVAILILATALIAWLGYFGGPIFTDLPADAPQRPFAAVVLSSDTGFNTGMAPDMAQRLADHGVAVVGVNTLTYMRRTRTPADVTRLIAVAERRAMRIGHVDRIVLIGQSFGADMVHVGLAHLPRDLRDRIEKVVMIVPEDNVQFRASPNEIFDWGTPTYDARPTAALLTWAPVLCVQGVLETNSLCPLMTQGNATRIALPGGHPLHHDPDALYDALAHFLFG